MTKRTKIQIQMKKSSRKKKKALGTTQEEEEEREKNELYKSIDIIYEADELIILLTFQAKNTFILNQWASQSLITF